MEKAVDLVDLEITVVVVVVFLEYHVYGLAELLVAAYHYIIYKICIVIIIQIKKCFYKRLENKQI